VRLKQGCGKSQCRLRAEYFGAGNPAAVHARLQVRAAWAKMADSLFAQRRSKAPGGRPLNA
jgi:hypothetical protein